MDHVAVAALGADQPGIVAAFAAAIEGAGASIEDSAMTILGGDFAMLLEVGGADSAVVRAALEPVAAQLGLTLDVGAGRATVADADATAEFVVAAYGPDRPGLVAALARVLADAGANITDFGSRLGASELFAMWFNVRLAAGSNPGELSEALAAAGAELGLDVTIHEAEATAT